MDVYSVDCVVVGAGVIGLACARALSAAGREVWVIERSDAIGSQTSSRNSEVIHAGIYYPPESLKAKLCVEGKHLLYDYCTKHEVAHRSCGKYIVASDHSQVARLDQIKSRAAQNGVDDLVFLDQAELQKRQPALSAKGALWSPSTGIVDSHGLMLSLQKDAEESGAQFVFKTNISNVRSSSSGLMFDLKDHSARIEANLLVNAAGIQSIDLASGIGGFDKTFLPQARFAKGSYFSFSGGVPFDSLIYPVPEEGGLGVHLTIDMQGRAKFGPNVEWLPDGLSFADEEPDYRVDPSLKPSFYNSVQQYWPGIQLDKLAPDYSGVRPKIVLPGSQESDFLIQGPETHGTKGLINLFGMESPGLTASLAIAKRVLALASD